MVSTSLLVIHADDLGMAYADHPADRRRHQLAVALARSAGVLDAHGVEVISAPGPMDDEQLGTMFAPAFVRAMRTYSRTPQLAASPEARQWGLTGDIHPYPLMHHDSARTAQVAWDAGRAVGEGRALRAISPAGGTHHGLANKAGGFGLYNDTPVAIHALKRCGLERVAYVDLDTHHGDGTQGMFWNDPHVLTVSVHESGQFLFPGTGFAFEVGGPDAIGSAVNVAMPPDSGDDAYRRVMAEVVIPAVRTFRPDAIVTQNGVDHHHADPLSHLLTTMPLYPQLWRQLREVADECCDGRWVALAGGGYDPCNAPPRAWAMLMAEMAGAPLPAQMPDDWLATAIKAGCDAPASGWLEDHPPAANAERDARVAREVGEAISTTLLASPLLRG
ncbi:MAG: acetoin utilization protein AcuC [Actinomycetota bacterium]|nr:acetoin utilization protein AcuC [Actinomycetota bacterium]